MTELGYRVRLVRAQCKSYACIQGMYVTLKHLPLASTIPSVTRHWIMLSFPSRTISASSVSPPLVAGAASCQLTCISAIHRMSS